MPSKKSSNSKKKSTSKSQSKSEKSSAPQPQTVKRSTTLESQITTLNDFWRTLTFSTRKKLLHVDACSLLKKTKEQYQRVCSCTVCGRNKSILDRELDRLFTDYCKELAYQNHVDCVFNFCSTSNSSDRSKLRNNTRSPKTTKRTVISNGTEMLTTTTVKKSGNVRVIEKTVKYYSTTKVNPNDKASSPIIEDITEDNREKTISKQSQTNGSNTEPIDSKNGSQQNNQHLPPPPPIQPEDNQEDSVQYDFGKNLSISREGIITISEDWIKQNESNDIIQLLQKFEHNIKHNNLENLILNKDKKNNNNNNSEDDEYEDDNDEDDDDQCSEDEDTDHEISGEESDDEEDVDEDSEIESENPEDSYIKWRESRRVFHWFAAKSFYENILTAFKEKQALDMQAKLIEEEEMTEKEKSEKKLKKKKEQEKKKQELEKQKKMEEERKKIEKEMIEIVKKEKQKKKEASAQKQVEEVKQDQDSSYEEEAEIEQEITQVLFENDMSDVKITPEQFPRYQAKPAINEKKPKTVTVKPSTVVEPPPIPSSSVTSNQSTETDVSSNDTMSSGNASTNNTIMTSPQPIHNPLNHQLDPIVQPTPTRKSPSPPNQQNNGFNSNWQPMNNAFQFNQFLPGHVNSSFNNAFQNQYSEPFLPQQPQHVSQPHNNYFAGGHGMGFPNNQNVNSHFNLFGQSNQWNWNGSNMNGMNNMNNMNNMSNMGGGINGMNNSMNMNSFSPQFNSNQPRMNTNNGFMMQQPTLYPQYQQWPNQQHNYAHNPHQNQAPPQAMRREFVQTPFGNSNSSLFSSDLTIGPSYQQQQQPSSLFHTTAPQHRH